MATYQSSVSSSTEPANLDLVRRYCPQLTQHTHEQIAQHLLPDAWGCWSWDGHITEQGYGEIWCEPTPYGYNQSVPAHRYMYELFLAEIPYGFHVHHRCFYRACWNPLHLEALSPQAHYDVHHPAPPPVPWTPPVQLTLAFITEDGVSHHNGHHMKH